MLITFEGIDGSGKTTQIALLKKWLEDQGKHVLVCREPGGTDLSETIRAILLNPEIEMNDVTEALLFSAARSQLISETVIPALKNDSIVILDRFYDSTTAYQGYARGAMDLEKIKNLNAIASHGLIPDVTFYIKISLETSAKRTASSAKDRMEKSGDSFYQKVLAGFETLAQQEDRFVIIDGEGTEDDVSGAIREELSKAKSYS